MYFDQIKVHSFFELLVPAHVKATRKHVDEIDPLLKLPNFAAIQYYALTHILVQSSLRFGKGSMGKSNLRRSSIFKHI